MGDLDAVKQVPGVVDSLRSVKTVEDQHQALEIIAKHSPLDARKADDVLIIVGTEDFAKASPAVQKESLNLVDSLLYAAEKDEAAKPTNSDAAKLTKTPDAKQLAEIDGYIKSGDRQKAIDKTLEYDGITTSSVKGPVQYDPTQKTSYNEPKDAKDTSVRIGPNVFEGADASPARLAATLLAASTQASQIEKHGAPEECPGECGLRGHGVPGRVEQRGKTGPESRDHSALSRVLEPRPGRPDS